MKILSFFKQAFSDMKKSAQAQHRVDQANFAAVRAESKASFAEARANSRPSARKAACQKQQEAAIAAAHARQKDAEVRIRSAKQ